MNRKIPSRQLLVANRVAQGRDILSAFGFNIADWIVVSPGMALAGHRFHKIIVMPLNPPASRIIQETWDGWFENMRTKLYPDGEIFEI